MSQNFLEIKDVTFAASKKNKVNNVTFNLEKEGEIICLLGPSGIGKTTILRTIAGLEKINTGDIFIDNKNMSDIAPKDRDIAMVFQSYALYPTMTVEKNITFGMKVRGLSEDI